MFSHMECEACKELTVIITQLHQSSRFETQAKRTQLLHRSFAELDYCALSCKPCRVFRRSLLLNPITRRSLDRDVSKARLSPVYVSIGSFADANLLCVKLGPLEDLKLRSFVALSAGIDREEPAKRYSHDIAKLKRRLEHCHLSHVKCRRLTCSQNNHTYLVRLFEDGDAQVMSAQAISEAYGPGLVQYVALTYAWGNRAEMSRFDWESIKMVRSKAPPNDSSTCGSKFARSTLAPAIRDALSITKDHFNVDFIWIDSLCIPQDSGSTGWISEARKMKEVYGNAFFTLAASSAQSAMEPLLIRRLAWEYPVEETTLSGCTLASVDMPLSSVRAVSPLCQRGWILQEELFSPRIFYWTAERVYWCCLEQEYAETSQVKCPGQLMIEHLSRPQHFIALCYGGQCQDSLETAWLELVGLLVRREFFDISDRLAAISVLAICYLRANIPETKLKSTIQLPYLSGLWRQTLDAICHGLSYLPKYSIINPYIARRPGLGQVFLHAHS
nr:hypothetical protein CFP56_41276 [Quercus suber]